jgi:hypothetical protein
VRPEFIRYLAENHAGELGALGICQQGIDRMKKGLDPVDPSGRLYAVNIDHIIERNGGGKASLTKEIDPQMPSGSKPTFLVNHFSNFVLLPIQVHELKNALNDLQEASKTPLGQSKWVLMIVPEAGPGYSGYVTQPQGQLQLLATHVQHTSALQLAVSTANQISVILEGITQNPEQEKREEELLKPALDDMAVRLKAAFNDASRPRQSLKPFLRFYQGEKFSALRRKVEVLPQAEAVELRRTMQWIDDGIKTRFNQYASRKKPANNNGKPANARKTSKLVVQQPQHVPHRHKHKKRSRR